VICSLLSSRGSRVAAFGFAGLLTLAVAACSGSGGARVAPPVAPTAASTSPGASQNARSANVEFKITWPAKTSATAAHRSRNYISPSTESVVIAYPNASAQPTTLVVPNPAFTTPASSSSAASPSPQTTVTIVAEIGSDTFTVGAYNTTTGTGSLLSENGVQFTIVPGVNNVVPITLNGNLASIVCAPVGPFVYETVAGTNDTYTQVGPTGQIMLLPEDAGGNIIVGPGTIPALTLAATTASAATVSANTSVTNEFNVSPTATGTAVALTASGTDLFGNAITNTKCNVTREEALYVTNKGSNASNPGGIGTQTVTIYPANASGDATPVATLIGSATNMSAIQFPAVDAQGNLYVSNQGPAPGATFNPNNSGYVTVYGPGAGQAGNQPPIATIANLSQPTGLAFDTSNDLYITTYLAISKYGPGLTGALGTPTSVITGSSTDIFGDYGMWVDSAGKIYSAGSADIAIFPAGTNGNVAPTLIQPITAVSAGGMTLDESSDSWLSVATDATGNIYAPGSNQDVDTVDEFMSTASGSTLPVPYGQSSFSQPVGIFIDSNGYFYIANYGNSSVEVFDSATALLAGTATATISGALTGLSYPFGVYAR
jgi:hypothetical protein